jgi:hypothetical protein
MNSIELMTTTKQSYEYGHNFTKLIYVKAPDKQSALDLIYDEISYAEGRRIYSDYDCTGEYFSRAIRLSDIKWCKAKKLYVASQRWNQDV